MTTSRQKRDNTRTKSFEVRLPASTSNLGPGFDCFGLALKLYLTIRATRLTKSSVPCRVRTTGARENASLPRNATNLIYRAMTFAAKRESLTLPPVDLAVHNEIPLASGLGSSAAAIVGGIKLCALLCEHEISNQTVQNYATEFEGHPDNVGASLYGGFVLVASVRIGMCSRSSSIGRPKFARLSFLHNRNCRHTLRVPHYHGP
jgi:homoserine kinase